MRKTKVKNKLKSQKAITLIALVVTIVVLLILAGITIASITGEKGIIKEARTSKELAEKKALEEQVESAIIIAEQKHKNPTLDDVIEELKNNKVISKNDQVDKETGSIITDAGYEITGKLDDYIGKISIGDGNTPEPPEPPEEPELPTFNPEELTIGIAQNIEKYGWKADYNVKENETGGWRLFFQDSNYTYLISNNCISCNKPYDYYTSLKDEKGSLKYQTGADVSISGRKLNPTVNTLFTSSNTNPNIRATAWLTDTSQSSMWWDYKSEDAAFSIGSPTLELFLASYNATRR